MLHTQYLSEKQVLQKLNEAANLYSKYADYDLMFIFRHSQNDTYENYGVHFGKRNFMHLAGIKSKNLNAVQFFQACVNGNLRIQDCNPRHDTANMHSKISIMGELLDLYHSKLYKIGRKNLITRDNDFEVVTGNSYGVIGYDSRVSYIGEKNSKNILPVPTTLLTNPISDYCSKPEKIMFILRKRPTDSKYNEMFYEIKKELFVREYVKLSESIRNCISLCI